MEELNKNYDNDRRVIDDLISKFREWSLTDNIVPSLKVKLEEAVSLLGDDCLKELQTTYEKNRDKIMGKTSEEQNNEAMETNKEKPNDTN